MAISVTHATVAAGTDAGNGEIAKDEWNEAHTLSMATARILGRVTASTGAVEELTDTQVRTLLGVDPVVGKQTIFIPARAFVTKETTGAEAFEAEFTTNDVIVYGYAFDSSTVEGIQLIIALPKQWDEGTVTFRYYWTARSGSGGVAFSLRGRAAGDDNPIDASLGTAITVTDTLTAVDDLCVSAESAAVTISNNPADGDLIWLEVERRTADGSDTLAADAILLGIDLFITTNAGTDA